MEKPVFDEQDERAATANIHPLPITESFCLHLLKENDNAFYIAFFLNIFTSSDQKDQKEVKQ